MTEGAKDKENRGVEIQSEMQDVQVCEKRRWQWEKKEPLPENYEGLLPNDQSTDKTKKEHLAHHGASSGMTPLSASCICWKSE